MSSVIAGRCRVGINVDLLLQVLNFKLATTVVGRRRLLQRITSRVSMRDRVSVSSYSTVDACSVDLEILQRYYWVRILFE